MVKRYSALDAYDYWNPRKGYDPEWVLASDYDALDTELTDLRMKLGFRDNELKSMARQKDEWHGRAAESVRLRRERDEARAALREIAEHGDAYAQLEARKALGLTSEREVE